MTPEPLKGKGKIATSEVRKNDADILLYFNAIDIKSAVEGCLEAVLDTLDVSSITRSDDVDRIRDIFKKWFHDVMQDERRNN